MTSVGCRSGVHWMRDETAPSIDCAIDAREHGLRGSRHVLEQRVTAAEERRDDERDLLALAVHDRLDVVEQATADLECRSVNLGCQPALPGKWILVVNLALYGWDDETPALFATCMQALAVARPGGRSRIAT